jgi:uncharacterized membrane protein
LQAISNEAPAARPRELSLCVSVIITAATFQSVLSLIVSGLRSRSASPAVRERSLIHGQAKIKLFNIANGNLGQVSDVAIRIFPTN